MAIIIKGRDLAQKIRARLSHEVSRIFTETGKRPGLAVIQIGEDPGSTIYVNNKRKACEEAGIRSYISRLPDTATAEDVLALVEILNQDRQVNGILCQLPIPSHLDEFKIICAIAPEKDVDGLHPINVGLLSLGRDCMVPCTPAGILAMLKAYQIPISGKHCVIIGRSNIVGKPIAQLMLREHATVTIAHSRSRNLPQLCQEADILIAALGHPHFVTADFIKPGAVVIDVGINRNAEGKVTGDVDFAAAEAIASAITPVPNGVGPMTIAMLLQSTVQAFCRQEGIPDVHVPA
jgi:methylenetetrahydrofolate dehydrogenase (NADP+) / methenyltetrahydrofolate cyclohydrolase